MVDSIDGLLSHRLNRDDLGMFGHNLLVYLVKDQKRVYYDRDSLAVEKTDGTYLTAEEAMRLYEEYRAGARCDGGSSGRVAYDGVVGWLKTGSSGAP